MTEVSHGPNDKENEHVYLVRIKQIASKKKAGIKLWIWLINWNMHELPKIHKADDLFGPPDKPDLVRHRDS